MEATDRQGIYKTEDGVLVNTDLSALQAYKKQKRMFQEMNRSSDRLDKLEDDISDIKSLLLALNGQPRD